MKLVRVVHIAKQRKQSRTVGDSPTQRSLKHEAFPALDYVQLYDNTAVTIKVVWMFFFLLLSLSLSLLRPLFRAVWSVLVPNQFPFTPIFQLS